ncbi:MAG: sigma-70 family RNA polymerase sigma factor [Myxococcales bacterium]|nr:sigma-70 family RNA polymerase sigma factor [Myxococcales bacterium]
MAAARDDFALLDAWAAGDRQSGGELLARHFPTVFRFFRNKITTGTEDLVQQTFLACVETHASFRRDASFRAFLLGTARNVLYNEFRRRRRKDDRIDFTSASAMDLAPSPSAIVAERIDHRLLLEALRAIPLDYQIALELHLWEGLTGPEMAQVLGLAEPGVRSRLRRAKEALGQRMTALRRSAGLLDSTAADLEQWAASLRDAAAGRDG